MSPALSLANLEAEEVQDPGTRIRELEDMLLVARREAEENGTRVVRLTAGLEQAAAMAQALESRGGAHVPVVAVNLVAGAISAVCQAALEEA